MSIVDNWLLLLPLMDDDPDGPIEAVNQSLVEVDATGDQQFLELDPDSWGGTKFPERGVYGLAANFLDTHVVLKAVKSAPWTEPERGRLLLSQQENDDWQVWRLNDLPDRL